MKKRISLLIILLVVASIILPTTRQPNASIVDSNSMKIFESSQSTHEIFLNITTDSGFVGYPGSGTPSDPFIIERITFAGYGTGIWIQDTTAYFVIRYCVISSSLIGDGGTGIHISNSPHARVENCEIENKRIGIHVDKSVEIVISEVTIKHSWQLGFYAYECNRGKLQGCSILDTQGHPLFISQSEYFEISGNSIINGQEYTSISDSDYTRLDQNVIEDCPAGIAIWSRSMRITNNRIRNGGLIPSLTLGEPYTPSSLENTTVNGRKVCWLRGRNGLNLHGEVFGQIFLNSCSNISITSGDFSNTPTGMRIQWCSSVSIKGIAIRNCADYGAVIGSTEQCEITNSTFKSELFVVSCTQLEISNNQISGSSTGIFVGACSNISVFDNRIERSSEYAFYAHGSDHVTIDQNYLVDNTFGYGLERMSSTMVSNSIVVNCTEFGFDLTECDSISFENITCIDAGFEFSKGYYLEYIPKPFQFNNISLNGKPIYLGFNESNKIIDAAQYGQIILSNSFGIIVRDGIFQKSSIGVQLIDCESCTVEQSNFEGTLVGVLVETSDSIAIQRCEFMNCTYSSIALQESTNSLIDQNLITGYEGYGVFIEDSPRFSIKNNIFSGVGIYSHYWNTPESVLNNTINEKELGFFYDQESRIINSKEFGQIVILLCRDFIIDKGNFSNVEVGVQLAYSNSCVIIDTQCSNTYVFGIQAYNCYNLTIDDCEFSYNQGIGLRVIRCANVTIRDSTADHNKIIGLGFGQIESGRIQNNTCNKNGIAGMSIWWSWDSIYCENEICENGEYGVLVHLYDGNLIYKNRIGGNGKSPVYGTSWYTSCWDDNNSIGNYWGIYSGYGVFHIPYTDKVDRYPQVLIDYHDGEIFELPIFQAITGIVTSVSLVVIILGLFSIYRHRKLKE